MVSLQYGIHTLDVCEHGQACTAVPVKVTTLIIHNTTLPHRLHASTDWCPLHSTSLAQEQERVRYEQLKVEFQLWTVGLGLLGGITTYTAYSKDVAVSYALGAVAGLLYLRLLSRSVDAGGSGFRARACGAD